jgi:hypothetical protein
MVLLSIQKQLTSADVAELAAAASANPNQAAQPAPGSRSRKPPSLLAVSGLRRFANTVLRLDPVNQTQALDEMADELVVSGDAETMLVLFEELSTLINARVKRL